MSDIAQLFASAMMHQMSLQEQQAQHAEQSRRFEQTLALQKQKDVEDSAYKDKMYQFGVDSENRRRDEARLSNANAEYDHYNVNSALGKYLKNSGISKDQFSKFAGKAFDPSSFSDDERWVSKGELQLALHQLDADERANLLRQRMGDEMKPTDLFNSFVAEGINPYASSTSREKVVTSTDPSFGDRLLNTDYLQSPFGIVKSLFGNNAPVRESHFVDKKETHVTREYLNKLGNLHLQLTGLSTKSSDTPNKLAEVYGILDSVLENPARGGGPGSGIDFASNFGQYGYNLNDAARGMLMRYAQWKSQVDAQNKTAKAKNAMEELKWDIAKQQLFKLVGENKDKGYSSTE